MIDLEVIGRHAFLFDDDAMATFVNSADALVQWNSLLIDRYDVRHLLNSLPLRRSRQLTRSPTSSSTNSDLDHERYQDLPPPFAEQDLDEEKFVDAGGYRAVAFSYANPNDSTDQNKPDAGIESSGFVPPFPVPENLLQSLPTTYKVHQIIARTALFVATHGGQSEIILRVKQGDNPTFGFLMPDHHLHPYFRFLVENKYLLQSDADVKSVKEKGDFENNQSRGALSLLGSVYGSGEDEDFTVGKSEESKENVTKKDSCDGSPAFLHGSDKAESPLIVDGGGDQMVLKRPIPSKYIPVKKNTQIGELKPGTTHSTRKGESGPLVSATSEKSGTSSIQNVSKSKPPVLEPPSDVKRSINKIIEFIVKNGKQYEAVLIEQDRKYDRFPFLLPSSQYHPYYSKVLQEANQSKLTVKSFPSGKRSSSVEAQDKNAYIEKERNGYSLGPSSGYDIPYDSPDRKEKFKMVIGKSKKDNQDSEAGQPQVGIAVDAAAAAAILHAATRGLKYPDLGGILTNGDKSGRSSEGVVYSGKDIDSAEENMSKDEKMKKAERLKRAKMFVAKIKTENAPCKTDRTTRTGHISSVEPPPGKERGEVILDVNYSSEKKRKMEKRWDEDEYDDRKSRRKYRSRSRRVHEEEEEEEYEKRRDHDDHHHHHKRQKQQQHRRKKRHDGSDSSNDEGRDVRGGEKDDDDDARDREGNSSSSSSSSCSKKKHRCSRAHRRRWRDSSSDHLDDGVRRKRRSGHDKLEDKVEEELEEGEIDGSSTKEEVMDHDLSVVVVCGNDNIDGGQKTQTSSSSAASHEAGSQVVSDDLRAKIRAMLMANM
ncbi:protein suppressor of white apricot [Impatiens glandulifera]|uniref:protein suppressor of white apricot n=1 Tax=Impatiens glandulifera TaxID=253017 RepID=UPI001FB07424|nr:protein suppressor of white apricot [Impatiens glandulifera]